MTAAITLRRRDERLQNLRGQILFYPEARLPFTPAATENNSGYYLECNGIFSFADHYLPRETPPAYKYNLAGNAGGRVSEGTAAGCGVYERV